MISVIFFGNQIYMNPLRLSINPNSFILIPPQDPAINCQQKSSRPSQIAAYCKNEPLDCVLPEKIYNKIKILSGFD
jgi:hypothetical protein